MKILVITNHSFMLWRFRRELIGQLLCSHEVVISVPFGDHTEDFQAIGCRMIDTQVDRRGINPMTDLRLYLTYRDLLTAEKPDLVVTYSIKPNIYAGFACRQLGIPYCANVQGLGSAFRRPLLSRIVTGMYRTALKHAKTVFFENEGDAEVFRNRNITQACRQCVLPGAGVNPEHFAYHEYPVNDRVHFLFLGRIMREKGVEELFRAVRMLHDENMEFVLDLVGFFEDEYKAQVESLAADGIAVFHGFCPDPVPFYVGADCVVLPSWHEGMSNVLLEAAAVGRPVITSDIPGCREAVLDGESGLLCPVRDAHSLYEKMKSILQTSRRDREEMGRRGRRLMEERFDKTRVVQKTMEGLFD